MGRRVDRNGGNMSSKARRAHARERTPLWQHCAMFSWTDPAKNGSKETFAASGTLEHEKWPCGPSLHNYREPAVTIPSPAREVTDGYRELDKRA
jgi:hypothetical protein